MQSIKKTLFLPIEIIPRELDSKLLIAHKALEKGYSIVIGPKGEVYKSARSFGSGIYFYKDHSPLSARMFQELKVAGLRIVAMDAEGLSWPSPEKYKSSRIDKNSIKHCDAIFVWGMQQYNILIDALPEFKEKFYVFGNPRFDILHKKYRQFIVDQAKHNLLISKKKYILINSMFAAGNWNPLMYGTPSYVEHLKIRGIIKTKEDYLFYKRVGETDEMLFKEYVSMLKTLSKLFPSETFIMRPHPDENHEIWHNIFADTDNVIIEYSGNATYWILGAKVLIYTGCTTAIEAWAMNKPTLRYHPIPETKFGPFLANKFGKTVRSEKKLIEELKRILNQTKNTRYDIDSDYVESFIKNGFSADAAENIVDVLDTVNLKDKHYSNHFMIFLNHLKKKINLLFRFDLKKRWRIRLINKLKRMLIKKNADTELKMIEAKKQKFPGLTKIDIETRLISLNNINGEKLRPKYDIIKIGSNTFKIDNPKTKL
jgi:surface carbohydrate biosynthesis protein